MKPTKILILFAVLFLLSAIFASPAFADCSLRGCIPDEGTCQEGAVMECQLERMKCQNGQWISTTEPVNNLCTYSFMGPEYSSLGKYQEKLEECAETGSVSLECLIGGPETVVPESYTGMMPAMANAATTMILGKISTEGQSQTYRPGGAIGGISNLIVAMYANPPASSIDYLADLGKNLGIVKPVYAQAGIGFQGLKPILPIWKAFRNIAYLFFTIVFVVIGFAIMFRVKINPQTVISIQNAIPRIVLALILVTFSYAIAGLLIDILYLALFLGITVMGWTGLIPPAEISELQNQFLTGGFPQLIGAMFKATPASMWLAFSAIGAAVGATIGAFVDPTKLIIPVIGGLVGGALFDLIIVAILLYVLFKLLIELIKAYISIILAVIFAPLQIMLNAIPGQNTFGSWLRNLFANIAVFPAVAIFVLIARALTGHIEAGKFWTPPMMIGGLGITAAGLIGFGMLLLLSKVPQMVKETLQLKPFPYGAAIGEAFGPVRGGLGVAWPTGRQAAYERWLHGAPPGTARGIAARTMEIMGLARRP